MKSRKTSKDRVAEARGFSTLEILIAFAIVIFALSAAASVTFGAQALVLDGELTLDAVSRAKEAFEKTLDFNQIVTGEDRTDDFFAEKINVLDITPCVKKMSVTEEWLQEKIKRSTSISQIFSYPDFVDKVGEACSGPELFSEDWINHKSTSFPTEIKNITDIDVAGDTAFISSDSPIAEDVDLAIFDIKNSYSKISELDIGAGILAIDFADGYIFAVTDATTSQLVVIDVRDTAHPAVIATRGLTLVDPEGSYPQGRSIKYFDSKVYIGTKETAGPEFHIFDVSNKANPLEVGFLEMTHNINNIDVRDGIAYLAASANNKELIVLDVKNPLAITQVGSFDAGTSAVNDRDATSIYLLGNTIYLGRKRGSALNPELYLIDVSLSTSPTLLGSFYLSLSGASSNVSGIRVSSNIAFVTTTDPTNGLFVLDVSDPKNIKKISTTPFLQPLSAIDLKDGVVYGASSSDTTSDNKIYEEK